MANYLSEDLRIRVIEAVEAGSSRRGAAARFGVSVSSAIRWVDVWAPDGPHRALSERRRPAVGTDRGRGRVLAGQGGGDAGHHTRGVAGAAERARPVGRDRHGVAVLRSPWDQLQKKTAHAAEQERPDVAARRWAWFESQPDLDPRRLVFIDETGASTKMARLRGRSKRGQRCRGRGPTWTLEDNHLHRRSTPGWPDRADAPGRADEWGRLPCLCRAGPRSHPWYRVIRSSWTTCPPTRSPVSNKQSRRPARHACSCRLTHPTSIPSNKPSQNSRHCSERPPPAPSMTSGLPSPRSSSYSHQPNAQTSSSTQDMTQNDRKML